MPRGKNLTPEARILATMAAKANTSYTEFKNLTNLAMPGRDIPENSQKMLKRRYIQNCNIQQAAWKGLYQHVLSIKPSADVPKKAFALVAFYAQIPTSEWQQFYPGEGLTAPQHVPLVIQQIHQNDWQILWNHAIKPKSNFGKG
ncbi:MAG: hypothetical protein CL685_03635 [Candidatus Magasanikbacteria bacterium]|nr:hypothetical protein [Candidatus Magasanikbacteria bacterium]|tara:strand:- start:8001 stop:8432 length:432 start_codon:yes stop_codon:yes gene_type:complete